jgi:UDP-3-O-[3-hydroxymyristoyl] glucosamine N-acyltransferase
MGLTLAEVAELVDGRLRRDADAAVAVESVAAIDEARPGDLTFCTSERYLAAAATTRATAVLANVELADDLPESLPAVICEAADYGFALVAERLLADYPPREPGIHPTAVVAESAILGAGVSIQPYAVIDAHAVIGDGCVIESFAYVGYRARLGKNCHIYQHAVVREHCILGGDVILQPGAIIGADGFGYAPVRDGFAKIPQLGTVVLEDDVEIGANAAVDRARFEKTIVRRAAKIDNLVQIAHNCDIGAGTMMAALCGLSGSTTIGSGCMLGGQVGSSGHVAVGDRAMLGARTAVISDLPGNAQYLGEPATPANEYKRQIVAGRRVPQALKTLRALEARVAELEAKLAGRPADGDTA